MGLVIDQQYNQGIDSDGNPLRVYFATYMKSKEMAGLYRGHTDFNLTGEFHGEMNVAIIGDEYAIESASRLPSGELKSEWLEKWNGSPIMDLTPENKDVAKAYLQPLFAEKMGEVLQ